MIKGDWNGAGCHTNVSTKETRGSDGIQTIHAHIDKLSKKHAEHIAVYGEHNTLRLTGKHETAPITMFRAGMSGWSGVGGRSVGVGGEWVESEWECTTVQVSMALGACGESCVC